MNSRLIEAKERDLVSVFEGYGIHLSKEGTTKNWYLSPFGNENTPSCCIDKQRNTFNDFSAQKRGDSIDFVMAYEGLTFKEAISKLIDGIVPVRKHDASKIKSIKTGIEVIDVRTIKNPSLILYCKSRGIEIDLVRHYCDEVEFVFADWDHVSHTAVGFKNDKGGYELRSPSQKVGNSPKHWTTVRGRDNYANVFEGFFDFLSFLMDNKITYPEGDTYILNGLAFAPWVKDEMDGYSWVNLYLDNGAAAQDVIEKVFNGLSHFDRRNLFNGHGDYNEYWKEIYLKNE
jgi:hypothetical protein